MTNGVKLVSLSKAQQLTRSNKCGTTDHTNNSEYEEIQVKHNKILLWCYGSD